MQIGKLVFFMKKNAAEAALKKCPKRNLCFRITIADIKVPAAKDRIC